ncbi:tudor domain-containing protein 1-like isoform X2 [Apostichopus japonicus]|uniref:tudor domain-containing protein 1-like isoform X2 n=1 Tax=Stichopus japonicus TaxID=307972 RepID=UPI003AB4CBEC
MASQNERYRKMLQEKVELLENQRTEVRGYITSMMETIDKATECSQKFMKISTESKKFRKKFQEANSAVESALGNLLKISNAFTSSNGEGSLSSSESDSATESSKPSTKISPRRDTGNCPVSASSKPSKGSESSSPSSAKDKADSAENIANTSPGNQSQKVSVHIDVASLQRTVSVEKPESRIVQAEPESRIVQAEPESKIVQTEPNSRQDALSPSVQSFLASFQDVGVLHQCKDVSVPITQPQPSHMPPAGHSQLRRPDIAQIAKHSPPRARTVHNMNKLNGAPPNAQLHVDTRGGAQGIPEGQRAQQFPPHPSGVASSHATHHPPTPSPTFSSHSSAGGLNLSLAKSRIPLLSPRCGDQIEAVISHVVSPSLFWIQDKRSCVMDLVQQLNNFYSQANIPIPIPERGLVCCARWSLDGGWYRAQIVDVQYPMQTNPNSTQQDIVVHVFFIDYGNSEALTTRNIRCLHKKFYEVPPLALRCALAQITPPQKTGQWTNECNMFFNALCIDKCLRADVVELKLQPNGVTFVRLSFCQESKLEEGVTREELVDVAELLVEKGLAKFIDSRVVPHSHIDVSPATVIKPEAQTPPSTSEPTSERPTWPASSTSQRSGQTVERRPAVKEAEGKTISEPVRKENKQTTKAKGKSSEMQTNSNESNKLGKAKKRQKEITLRKELTIIEDRILVAMSFIANPNDFYVHLIAPDVLEFDALNDKLQEHYNDSKNVKAMDSARSLGVGDFCCAKFEKDSGWYRGKILEVRSVGPKGKSKWDFMVFYVDYGNSEWVLETNVKPLVAEFYDMPAQVVKCSLAHVSPFVPAGNKDCKAKWSEQATTMFRKLTGFNTKLNGFLVTVPEDKSKAIELNLTISTSHMEVYVNQELVNLGLASSDILKKESVEDDELEIASSNWLNHRYQEGGYADSDTGLPESPDSLMDALAKLDPMAVHYHAEINTYGYDEDDPEMATMGYKSNLDKKVCYFHVSGKGCYRGDSCQFEHPDPDEVKDTTDCYCINNVVDLLPEESVVCILVTAVISPIHFWVQFVFGPTPLKQLQIHCSKSLDRPWEEGETLESLNESINNNCSKGSTKSHDMTILALGEIVLAKYSKDKKWYRSRVIFVDEDKIEVFHVDYGTSDWVTRKDVRPALPQFLHLPFQAVQCRLDGLEESQECKEQRDNSRNYFEDVATGHPLVAYVVERDIDNLLYLKLYNTKGEEDICINKALLDKGYYLPGEVAEKGEKVSN